jgi:alpha-galactosidase
VPFILHPQARVVRQHPDWLLRDRWGIPVTAGFVWNRLTYALDLSVPAALDYACSVVKTATEVWGFPYLKLDFLYAGALAGKRRDETLTRAQVLRQACEAIRRSVGPETTLLGCGVPLGTALGLFEAVRIGADVSGDWAPAFLNHKRFFDPEPGMPSARNAIQNILTRATLHQRWWVNDPDCLLVRPDTHLSLPEVQTLATTIGMTGGSLLVSDDLPALPVERIRIAQVLLPPIDRRPVILDWFDSPTPSRLRLDLSDPDGHGWSLLAWFNWTEETVTVNLHLAEYGLDPEKEYLASSFWTEECQTTRDGRLGPFSVPAHGVLLLRTTQKPAQARPAYVGSDLHLSQGFEMTGFEAEGRQVRVRLELPRKAEGVIRLALPFEPVKASQDGSPVAWKPMGEEIYQFQVKFDRTARLEVTGS